jgi:hypothetical protein
MVVVVGEVGVIGVGGHLLLVITTHQMVAKTTLPTASNMTMMRLTARKDTNFALAKQLKKIC